MPQRFYTGGDAGGGGDRVAAGGGICDGGAESVREFTDPQHRGCDPGSGDGAGRV